MSVGGVVSIIACTCAAASLEVASVSALDPQSQRIVGMMSVASLEFSDVSALDGKLYQIATLVPCFSSALLEMILSAMSFRRNAWVENRFVKVKSTMFGLLNTRN